MSKKIIAAMTADLFMHTETNARPWDVHVAQSAGRELRVEVPDDATVDEILAVAHAAGMPKGSSRSGVFQIQTDNGIFQHADARRRERGYGRITTATSIFQTWAELEASE